MKAYNRYILALVLASGIINVVLAFAGLDDLGMYFAVNVIAYLVVTLFFTYLNPGARKSLNNIGVILFVCFLAVVFIRVAGFVSGR